MATNVQYRADLLAEPLPPATDEFEESSIDLFAVARVLSRHWRFIAGTSLIFCLLATAGAFYMRDQFTARVSFIPASSNSPSMGMAAQFAQMSGFGGLFGGGGRTSGDLYMGLIRSTTMQSRMIARFNMMSVYKLKSYGKTEARFSSRTGLFYGKDGIFSLYFTDHDPVRARDVAEAYLQELQQVSGNLALTESSQRRLFFEGQLKREKDALADAEVALKQNEEKTGVIAPAGQASSELQSMAALRMQIADRRVRLASLLHDETDQNPAVLRLRSEIGSLEAQLTQMHNGKTGTAPGAIPNTQVPGLELDFIRLAREVKYHETLYDALSRQYEAARLDESHDTPLQLLDHARLPEGPSGPPRLQYISLATLFGLFVSALYVLFRYFFHPRIHAAAAARV